MTAGSVASRSAPPSTRLLVALLLVAWSAASAPLALGRRTLFQRDVFAVQLHLKAVGAEALELGKIPAFHERWALGQPYRGNPNALAFYPGNLLYLALPFWSAFNLHFALHWLLAVFTMRALARELGQSAEAALLAGVTYAGSGWLLSGLTFYNILAVAAWWPLLLAGAHRGGRRGCALGAVAAGMAFLCGEPITTAIGLLPLLLVAVARHGWRRGLPTAAAIVVLGGLIALPQLVATLQILPFTVRGSGGMSLTDDYIVHPVRLLELFFPLPFGVPVNLGETGYLRQRFGDREPFFYSLHFGVVGLLLTLGVLRARRMWASLAVGGLVLALFGGLVAPVLAALSRGAFRYPEKFLFWFALAMPLLVGWGFDRGLPSMRLAKIGIGAAAVGAVGALTSRAWAPAALGWLSRGEIDTVAVVRYWSDYWSRTIGLTALVVLLSAIAIRRRSRAGLAVLQVVPLLALAPLVQTDATALYTSPPPFARHLPRGASVAMSTLDSPIGTPRPAYRLTEASRREFWRIGHLDLDYPTNIAHGFEYPFPTDFDGLISPLHDLLLDRLPAMGWSEQIRWLRLAGLDAVTLPTVEEIEGLERVETSDRFGVATSLYRVRAPAPLAWWPESVETLPSQLETMRRLSALDDLQSTAFVARDFEHRPGGVVGARERDGELEVEVVSPGGVLVVRRSYHPMLEARIRERELRTAPADLILTAIEVPPGRHVVTIGGPAATAEWVGGAIAVLVLAGALVVLALPQGVYERKRNDRSSS